MSAANPAKAACLSMGWGGLPKRLIRQICAYGHTLYTHTTHVRARSAAVVLFNFKQKIAAG
jgi:hypothetical protein